MFEKSKKKGITNNVSGAQSIERALAMLRLFGISDGPLDLSELSATLGLSFSTTHRIARVMAVRGFLIKSQDGTYRLGGISALLGAAAATQLGLESAMAILNEIGSRYSDAVSLGVREGNMVGVVLRVEAKRDLRFSQRVGSQAPLHASSMGKAILMGSPDFRTEAEALGALQRFTSNTICDREALIEELELSRDRGFSLDNEEQLLGVRCIGAPILDSSSRVKAAFAIQAPAPFMDDDRVYQIGEQMPIYARRLAEVMNVS